VGEVRAGKRRKGRSDKGKMMAMEK